MLTKRIERLVDILQAKLDGITEEEEIGSTSSTGIKGVNRSFRLTNKDNEKFLFKPQSGDHTSKWRHVPPKAQYKRERAAYLTSVALGWNMVPHTKIMTHNEEIGSLQDWVEEADIADKTLKTYSISYLWKAGLFDIIIGNSDRHSKNWLTVGDKPILIDHGYSFPIKASISDPRSVILSRFSFRIWGDKIPNIFLQDIKKLKESKFQEHIKSLVDNDAFILFNERVDELLGGKIAQVSKYNCVKKVSGTPSEK